MANTKDFFLKVTQRIFSNWTALRMAVEHDMGSKESAMNFCPYITEVMYMNNNLASDDIAAELEEYMDNEFNTELQDSSSIEVAEQLLKFHRYCIQGNEAMAVTEMEKLPLLQPWILSQTEIRRPINSSSANEVHDSENEQEMTEMSEDTMETVDEAWIKVKTRRKK